MEKLVTIQEIYENTGAYLDRRSGWEAGCAATGDPKASDSWCSTTDPAFRPCRSSTEIR